MNVAFDRFQVEVSSDICICAYLGVQCLQLVDDGVVLLGTGGVSRHLGYLLAALVQPVVLHLDQLVKLVHLLRQVFQPDLPLPHMTLGEEE